MASIYKAPNGRWKASVRTQGYRSKTKTFDKQKDAISWASAIEFQRNQYASPEITLTLEQVLDRFSESEVHRYSSSKNIQTLIRSLRKHLPNLPFAQIRPPHLAAFRDHRLVGGVCGSTVRKELNFLSKIYEVARTEWGYSELRNPVKDVRKPPETPPKDRRPKPSDIQALLNECKRSGNHNMHRIIEIAIETAMRQGELLSARIELVDFDQRLLYLPMTKNGEPRHVPLSTKAITLLQCEIGNRTEGPIFLNWSSGNGFRTSYRRICARAGVSHIRFHDLRHEGASRLFEKGLNPFQVAVVTGHKSLQSLKRYTHLKAGDIARLLD